MYQSHSFSTCARFSPAPEVLFSRSRLRGTHGACLYTTVPVWVPVGLRGACSGRSKSRNLASNHGVAFRGARAEHDNGKPTCQLFCATAVQAFYFVAATVQQQLHIKYVWTSTMRVGILHMRVCAVCDMIRVRVCRCVRVCVSVCWNPTFQLCVFFLMLLLPYHVVCITPSLSSQALYFAATVQQQSHSKCGPHALTCVC